MASFLQIEDLTKSYGDRILFESITFGVNEGDKIGIIAKNGTGKSTLLKIISGKETADEGKITFRSDLRVGILDQMPEFTADATVLDSCLLDNSQTAKIIAQYEYALTNGDANEINSAISLMDNANAWDYEDKLKQLLTQLKITDLTAKISTLSGGQRKRVALARLILENPDLIILTGDNVYGRFDHNGSVWTAFVNFMDSFDIPWAPVFGNHDAESNMGVDWQCEQLMNAENCLFKQRELTGNCNYSVAIEQGGEIKRVFYMLDSNGVGSPSKATLANGHTSTTPGFASDQIAWYTEQITRLQETLPDLKISFAYHIQSNLFELAYAKYGYVTWQPWANINVDLHEDKAEGDFGYIGYVKGEWTQDIDALKALGVDSMFIGHEHTSSSSVVYDGIRFQFGQKSSRYDMFSMLDKDGNVKHSDWDDATDSPLIGGSVIVLSEEDGGISDAYIYYCADAHGKVANGEIQWESFMETLAKAGKKQYMVLNKRYA